LGDAFAGFFQGDAFAAIQRSQSVLDGLPELELINGINQSCVGWKLLCHLQENFFCTHILFIPHSPIPAKHRLTWDFCFVFYFVIPNFGHYRASTVKISEKPQPTRTRTTSSEALIGIGITIAALGLLGFLLGVAEHFRSVAHVALVWFVIGAILMIVGGLITAAAWSRKRRG
jgi:uncharacterized membrane protein YidH (DUF202 family)